jgi:NCS1 family nucleobase:cation symporter-1
MANSFRQRVTSIKEGAKAKTKPSGWIIPKQKSTFGDEDTW